LADLADDPEPDNGYLRANAGADAYIYAFGHCNDEIDDPSGSATDIDTLKFSDLNESDITVGRAGRLWAPRSAS
jgi:hypothetical protein